MISSAISADLGRQEALRGSQEALATVTGIVDGTGSLGAAAGQVGTLSGGYLPPTPLTLNVIYVSSIWCH